MSSYFYNFSIIKSGSLVYLFTYILQIKSDLYKNKIHVKTSNQLTLIIKAYPKSKSNIKLTWYLGNLLNLRVGHCQKQELENNRRTFCVHNIKTHSRLHMYPHWIEPQFSPGDTSSPLHTLVSFLPTAPALSLFPYILW